MLRIPCWPCVETSPTGPQKDGFDATEKPSLAPPERSGRCSVTSDPLSYPRQLCPGNVFASVAHRSRLWVPDFVAEVEVGAMLAAAHTSTSRLSTPDSFTNQVDTFPMLRWNSQVAKRTWCRCSCQARILECEVPKPGNRSTPSSHARWIARYAVRRLQRDRAIIAITSSGMVKVRTPDCTHSLTTFHKSSDWQVRGRPPRSRFIESWPPLLVRRFSACSERERPSRGSTPLAVRPLAAPTAASSCRTAAFVHLCPPVLLTKCCAGSPHGSVSKPAPPSLSRVACHSIPWQEGSGVIT